MYMFDNTHPMQQLVKENVKIDFFKRLASYGYILKFLLSHNKNC